MASSVERKHFEFTLGIQQVQFNNLGSFYLRISIKSAFSDNYSGLWVKPGPGAEYEPGHTVTTDTVIQERKKDFLYFKKNDFAFFLPKGFCKNDQNHDVFLLVEAFQESDQSSSAPRRVGEAKYAIFPRTDKPRANLSAPPGENMYKHTLVMSLLRTVSTERIQQHCGRMKCVTTFAQMLNPPVQTPRDPFRTVPRVERTPTPPQPAEDASRRSPEQSGRGQEKPDQPIGGKDSPTWPVRRTPTPDLGNRGKTQDSPYDRPTSPNHRIAGLDLHVAAPGREDIVVILHGAANIPSLDNGKPPEPFCSLKTSADDSSGAPAQMVSRAPGLPTHSPSYEEGFVVEYDGLKCLDEVLKLQFADKASKEILVTYNLPVSVLWPFHQYHLEMVMPTKHSSTGVRVFATIMRRQATLPHDLSSPNYLALEVYLQGVEQRLKNPVGRLIAVGRIVPDYYSYKWVDSRLPLYHPAREMTETSDNLLRNSGLSLTSVTFPSPHPSLFAVPDSNTQGYPQITLPCGPPQQPEWDHSFLFTHTRDKATLFTPSAALVLEYYQADKAMSDMSWRLRNPIGYSTLLLDQGIYRQLVADGAKLGIQVRHLPIQGTDLKTVTGKTPTVGMVLKLITTERPSCLTVPSDPNALPFLQYLPQDENDNMFRSTATLNPSIHPFMASLPHWNHSDLNLRSPSPETEEPGYWVKQRVIKTKPLQDDAGDLPAHNAIENILPEYQYIFVDPDTKRNTGRQPKGPQSDTASLHLVDHQMRELEKYRAAVHTMGADILGLRGEIRDLEGSNSRLRRDLSKYNDSTRLLMDSQELDGLTKPELAARYVALKQKLTSQTGELRDYKERVQTLQNDLIKKNDLQKDYLRMSQAHTSQNDLLQRLQDKVTKVKRLEDACRKQERVIEKMERILGDRGRGKNTSGSRGPDPTTEALIEENRRLRSDIDDLRDSQRVLQAGRGLRGVDDEEKLAMLERSERADGRIRSLEKQLSDNARSWGREKSDLLTKLQEAELGLRRTTTLNPNPNTYSYDSALRNVDPRRYSKPPNTNRRPKYTAVGGSKYN